MRAQVVGEWIHAGAPGAPFEFPRDSQIEPRAAQKHGWLFPFITPAERGLELPHFPSFFPLWPVEQDDVKPSRVADVESVAPLGLDLGNFPAQKTNVFRCAFGPKVQYL